MTRSNTRIGAVAVTAILVLSLMASAAVGAAAAANQPTVTTEEPTDVTESSATLQGNLSSLGNATNATVSFEYWVDGDAENGTAIEAGELNETGAFEATVDELSANTTYVVVATANVSGASADGDEQTFDTRVEDWKDDELPFGQRVSAYVHALMGGSVDGPLGQQISEWVTAHNPANDNKPDHAGPDNDRGESSTEDDDERGSPEHANNDKDDGDDGGDEESSDNDRGPPEHANNDKDDE